MEHSTILELIQNRAYSNNYQPPKEEIILTIDGRICGTMENIICFTGLPKAGKSSYLTACIASAFTAFPIFDMKINLPKKRNVITYIDTESSQYDFYKGMDRIKGFLQLKAMPKNLHAYHFRDLNQDEIKDCIEYYLNSVPECSVLIVDGLLDLLLDYNDPTESRHLINWLKKITSQKKIMVIGVVHTGKSNNQTLGTFGSMIDRYCQTVVIVEKNPKENIYELKPKFLRSDADFGSIAITNINGVFQKCF